MKNVKNHHLFLIFLSCLLLLSGTCKKDSETTPPYFECDYYNYLPNNGFPTLTLQDSADVAAFLNESGMYNHIHIKRNKVGNPTLFYYLQCVKNEIDTALFNRYLAGVKNQLKPIYRSLDWKNLYPLIMTDAVVFGRIIDMHHIRDSSKCLLWKTRYVVQVDEVLYSRFSLKKGNYLLGGLTSGYQAGCLAPNDEELFFYDTFMKYYKSGEKKLFSVSKQNYRYLFLGDEYLKGRYQDEYCPNMFSMMDIDIEGDKRTLRDIRKFYKKHKRSNGNKISAISLPTST